MLTPDDIYKIAAPKKEKVEIAEGKFVNICEVSVQGHKLWSEFLENNKDDIQLSYCFLISLCCEELKGQDYNEINRRMSSKIILDIGNRIADLSGFAEKKS